MNSIKKVTKKYFMIFGTLTFCVYFYTHFYYKQIALDPAFKQLLTPSELKTILIWTHYDVVMFHGRKLPRYTSNLPQRRSPHQKYVFASMESSAYYPVCNKMYNGYFNWTWTYKLKSDDYYGYMIIKNNKEEVIGPKQEMHWEKVEDMMPIDDTLKAKLSSKKIAAAWFVSNCGAPSGRDVIAKQLQTELEKYNMTLDIFGRCGTKKCFRSNMMKCLKMLETDYYFYLSFENSLSEDYVTEKLLTALNHYTVPIVYGGANYTRFMPDGIYLSVQQSSIKKLAKKMVDIINDKQKYYDFFRWHNHYSYSDGYGSPKTDPYCRMCAFINNKEQFLRTSTYEDFLHWFTPPCMSLVSTCLSEVGKPFLKEHVLYYYYVKNLTVKTSVA